MLRRGCHSSATERCDSLVPTGVGPHGTSASAHSSVVPPDAVHRSAGGASRSIAPFGARSEALGLRQHGIEGPRGRGSMSRVAVPTGGHCSQSSGPRSGPRCTTHRFRRDGVLAYYADVRCLRAFLPRRHLELHGDPVFHTGEAVLVDGTAMHENILAAVARFDETEFLGVVEPLYGTLHGIENLGMRYTPTGSS